MSLLHLVCPFPSLFPYHKLASYIAQFVNDTNIFTLLRNVLLENNFRSVKFGTGVFQLNKDRSNYCLS
jgi:hypothetical protein